MPREIILSPMPRHAIQIFSATLQAAIIISLFTIFSLFYDHYADDDDDESKYYANSSPDDSFRRHCYIIALFSWLPEYTAFLLNCFTIYYDIFFTLVSLLFSWVFELFECFIIRQILNVVILSERDYQPFRHTALPYHYPFTFIPIKIPMSPRHLGHWSRG